MAGRPHRLHVGDELQIRHSLRHPELGLLRNGTTGEVIGVDAERELVQVRLAGEREVRLSRGQLYQADIRLDYVQHPFPV